MDASFGLRRPASLAAVTMAQSAPGLSTALAEALFHTAPCTRGEPPAATKATPRPANDRHAAGNFLGGLYRFGRRAVGW